MRSSTRTSTPESAQPTRGRTGLPPPCSRPGQGGMRRSSLPSTSPPFSRRRRILPCTTRSSHPPPDPPVHHRIFTSSAGSSPPPPAPSLSLLAAARVLMRGPRSPSHGLGNSRQGVEVDGRPAGDEVEAEAEAEGRRLGFPGGRGSGTRGGKREEATVNHHPLSPWTWRRALHGRR